MIAMYLLTVGFLLNACLCIPQEGPVGKDAPLLEPTIHHHQYHRQQQQQGSRLGPQNTSSLLPMMPVEPWVSYHYVDHLWSTKYHFFACLVPKCGSTGWLRLIYRMHLSDALYKRYSASQKMTHDIRRNFDSFGLYFRPRYVVAAKNFTTAFKPTRGNALVESRAITALNNASIYKFAIVRHPWSRLVSGFLDKYVHECNKSRTCFQYHFASKLNAALHIPVSLTELLLALLHQDPIQLEIHFRPTVHMCDIGRVPYDFIADSDNPAHMLYLLQQINSSLPLMRDNLVKSALKPEDRRVACTRETVDLAARLYAKDLEAYGYTMDAAYKSCEKYGLAFPPQ